MKILLPEDADFADYADRAVPKGAAQGARRLVCKANNRSETNIREHPSNPCHPCAIHSLVALPCIPIYYKLFSYASERVKIEIAKKWKF